MGQTRDETIKNFKAIYEDYLAFVTEKGITLQNPLELVPITPDRAEALKRAVILAIKNATDKWRDCLGIDFDSTAEIVEKSFLKILDITALILSQSLRRNFKGESSSNSQLLASRSLFSHTVGIYSIWTEKVVSELNVLGLKMKEGMDWQEGHFANQVIFEAIFKEMKGHEIAFCRFSWGMYGRQIIFC